MQNIIRELTGEPFFEDGYFKIKAGDPTETIRRLEAKNAQLQRRADALGREYDRLKKKVDLLEKMNAAMQAKTAEYDQLHADYIALADMVKGEKDV